MRVAVLNLTGPGMSGGYKKYLRHVIPGMSRHPAVEAVLCALPQGLKVNGSHDWPVEFVHYPSARPYHWRKRCLRESLQKFSPDVLYVPLERSFRFGRVPVVNMVQNMEPFINNRLGYPWSQRVKLGFQYLLGKRAVRQADGLIASSKFVQDYLTDNFRVPKDKVGLIYYGTESWENQGSRRPPGIPEGWDRGFLFTAGSVLPARGLQDALEALALISEASPEIPGLAIAGEVDANMTWHFQKLRHFVQERGLASRIAWLGALQEDEMNWCYRHCQLFLMTSRVESFGLTGVEAMSHGCLSLVADNPCLPEIFGDAAVYYQPKDAKALAAQIRAVLHWNRHRKEELSQKAKKRAAQFDWHRTVEQTVAELAKAVGR